MVGWRTERVDEEHHVDVGRQGIGFEAVALERGPTHEGRRALDDVIDPFAISGRHHPVPDRDIDEQIAHPRRPIIASVTHHGAPTAVDARDPSRRSGRADRLPRRLQSVVPSERGIGHHGPNGTRHPITTVAGFTTIGREPSRAPRRCPRRPVARPRPASVRRPRTTRTGARRPFTMPSPTNAAVPRWQAALGHRTTPPDNVARAAGGDFPPPCGWASRVSEAHSHSGGLTTRPFIT